LRYPSPKDIEHFVARPTTSRSKKTTARRRFAVDDCVPQRAAIQAGKIEFHALSKGGYPGTPMEGGTLPGLVSVGYWDSRRPQDWGLQPHRNEGLEFVFLESGEAGFTVDGASHHLRAGAVTLTRPWQLHHLGDPNLDRGRLYWLILDIHALNPRRPWKWPDWVVLDDSDKRAFERFARRSADAVWLSVPPIREIFREIADAVRTWGQPRSASRLGVAVNRLLIEMLDLFTADPGCDAREHIDHRMRVKRFLSALASDPQLCARPWQIEEMAAHCEVGVTTLAKYCGELVNATPVIYLNACRADHAARWLKAEPSLSMTEVAMRCGFNSSQYFATVFRRVHRVSPKEYRAGSYK
jgi:AraC-like DNA-binding protein